MSSVHGARHRGQPGLLAGHSTLAAAVVITGAAIASWVLVAPAVIGTAGAGLGDGGGSGDDTSRAAPTPDAEPNAATSEVGVERVRTNADTVLLQVRNVVAPSGRTPPTGSEWFGIRARTCMHPDADSSGELRWSAWVVVTDAGERYAGREADWPDFPPQQYASSGLDGGQCQVGWALVSVPEGSFEHVVEVAYRPGSVDGASWRV